jgi:hypothetical protein
MLVDVVRLRSRGERISRGDVKAATPLRGQLTVFVRRDLHRNVQVVCAMIEGHQITDWPIPALDHMRLTRMHKDSFVLVGFEEVGQRKLVETFPQAWWCRVVCEVTGQSAAADDAEVEQVASVF